MAEVSRRIGRSVFQKMSLVAESWGLNKTDLGAFLRSKGLKSCELEDWRNQMSDGLDLNIVMNVDTKKSYQKKIAKLEKELNEARLVIEFQKKVRKTLADAERNTKPKSVKKSSKMSKKPTD